MLNHRRSHMAYAKSGPLLCPEFLRDLGHNGGKGGSKNYIT